jgi:hypothetical protein
VAGKSPAMTALWGACHHDVRRRSQEPDILLAAAKDRKQAVQLSKTWPGITIEDAYAISTEVTNRKIAAGAKLIGHKVGHHVEGDAAFLADRRAGFRISARRHDDR